jgi:hypothetical protein
LITSCDIFRDDPALKSFFSNRHDLLAEQHLAVTQIIADYLRNFVDQSDWLWQRIQSGFWLYQLLIDQYRANIKPTPSRQQATVNLIQQKMFAAIGHHRKVLLAGKSLDEWFKQQPFDSKNFLHALKQSAYFNAQTPEKSPLLKLFDFEGPMFGVLSDEEQKILKRGLKDLTTGIEDNFPDKTLNSKPGHISRPPTPHMQVTQINYSQQDNRQLYHYLLNADLFPDVTHTARRKVKTILRLSRLFHRPPFKQYRHQRLDKFVQFLYQQEINSYHPLTTAPRLSKQAYIWGIEQFAPTILIDGCWLQHWFQLQTHCNQPISDILLRIYRDEMGNGILHHNHPFVYRQLLNSLQIKLPATPTRQFSNHPGFIDSAFDLPVYLLAISRLPAAFLPELLGLNLAIELSGLGKVYMTLAEELEYWKINAKIVKLHLSIDNFTSGHTALAVQAIQLHLDEVLADQGELAMQRNWRRVYTGYCSLQTASYRFKYALIYHYGLKRVKNHFNKAYLVV